MKKLSRREIDVLGLIAEGQDNRHIAASLGISPYTVRIHVVSLMAKLGARTRAQAVAMAFRMGVLS